MTIIRESIIAAAVSGSLIGAAYAEGPSNNYLDLLYLNGNQGGSYTGYSADGSLAMSYNLSLLYYYEGVSGSDDSILKLGVGYHMPSANNSLDFKIFYRSDTVGLSTFTGSQLDVGYRAAISNRMEISAYAGFISQGGGSGTEVGLKGAYRFSDALSGIFGYKTDSSYGPSKNDLQLGVRFNF